MSKDTKKDVNKTFRTGEFATSKGLSWTGKALDKGAKFASEWKNERQERKADSLSGASENDSLGIQTQVDKPNSDKIDFPYSRDDNSVKDATGSSKNLPIDGKDSKYGNVLGIKTMESAKAVSSVETILENNNKNSVLPNIKTLMNDGVERSGKDNSIKSDFDKDSNGHLGRLVSFVNRHTFDFQPTQGKISKGVTVVGKTSVGAGKVIKKGARLSHKVDKVANGEDATGMNFVESEVGRKAGNVAVKAGKKLSKTTAEATFKGSKKTIKYSYTRVKSSLKKGYKSAKATGSAIKNAVMTVFRTVATSIGSLLQALSPFFIAVLAGTLCFCLFIVVLAGSSSGSEKCSTDYVYSDGTTEGNAQAIWTFLKGKGLSDEAVAGVMGNMERESGFNPSAIEKGYPYQGHGLIQWSYGRKDRLLQQATLKGVSWTDLNFQLNFLWEESLSPESYYGRRLQSEGFYDNKSPSKTAYLFHKIVEVSAESYDSILNTRCKSAEKWYDKLKGTYKLTDSTGCSFGSIAGDPNFGNLDAWITKNPYAQAGLYGQCTWFAWGRFYEIYGYSPGFSGNGYACVAQLLATHPDKFEFSLMPKVGAVGSSDVSHNHVWIVVGVDGDLITVQEGNLNGITDSFEVAKSDWHTTTYTLSQLKTYYGNVCFANPK